MTTIHRGRIVILVLLLALVAGSLIGTYVHAAPPARRPVCGWMRKAPCWATPMGGTCYIWRCR